MSTWNCGYINTTNNQEIHLQGILPIFLPFKHNKNIRHFMQCLSSLCPEMVFFLFFDKNVKNCGIKFYKMLKHCSAIQDSSGLRWTSKICNIKQIPSLKRHNVCQQLLRKFTQKHPIPQHIFSSYLCIFHAYKILVTCFHLQVWVPQNNIWPAAWMI